MVLPPVTGRRRLAQSSVPATASLDLAFRTLVGPAEVVKVRMAQQAVNSGIYLDLLTWSSSFQHLGRAVSC